jgi:ATP-dependent protease ClpP protease subunit
MDKQTNEIIKRAGGDVIKVIQLEGEVLEGETLDNLKQQTGDITQFDTLVLEIASPGGSVSEGLATMVWLEDMSKQGKHIVTVVTANAYSIASLIMLVADIKLISTHAKVMVHNPMVPLLEYVNANDLQEYINSLRSLEDTMYQLYQFFTGLDIEQIKLLMDNETYLLPQEAVDKGFADMVVDIKPKSYSTASNIKKEINMSNTLNILNKVIGMVNKSEFINQLYSDLEGNEIEIFQKDASTYKVGDRTSMVEGEVLLSDGAKLTVVASEITDINRSAEEVSTATEAVAVEVTEEVVVEDVVAAEVATEEVVEEVVAKEIVTEEVVIDEVVAVEAVAEVKEEVVIEEVVAVEVAVEEVVTEEVVTDAVAAQFNEGEAPKMDMNPKMDEKMEEEKMYTEKMEMPEMVITQEHMDSMHVVIAQLDARVVALEKMCMGYDMKLEAISKFENIATEAIDTLATNTVSNFKPEAVSSPSKSVSGSIFNQLKGKRGLK